MCKVQSFIFFSSNFLNSSFNSVFLLSPKVILLWHKTILFQFILSFHRLSSLAITFFDTRLCKFLIPFFRNRILFSTSDTASFVCLANSSFTLASFICSSTFLCCSRFALYVFDALSHNLSSSSVTLILQCLLSQ